MDSRPSAPPIFLRVFLLMLLEGSLDFVRVFLSTDFVEHDALRSLAEFELPKLDCFTDESGFESLSVTQFVHSSGDPPPHRETNQHEEKNHVDRPHDTQCEIDVVTLIDEVVPGLPVNADQVVAAPFEILHHFGYPR